MNRQTLGRVLILIGVGAWLPYFYLEGVAGQDVSVLPFLAVHLTGIFGGAALRGSGWLKRILGRSG